MKEGNCWTAAEGRDALHKKPKHEKKSWRHFFFSGPKNQGQTCLDQAQRSTGTHVGAEQGCQMVSFQTKNPNLGKFWRTLEWKLLL
jgi:hypothetical protein